jgi:hypothetical protein
MLLGCPKPPPMMCYGCHPLKLMCNGLLQSIKSYLCCRRSNGSSGLRKQPADVGHHGGPLARSGSFAPAQFFMPTDRIYELHDTPTFQAAGDERVAFHHQVREK